MATEILTVAQSAELDRLAVLEGPLGIDALMERAGQAVASVVSARFTDAEGLDVLCGPGSNGGDGYVAARVLAEQGAVVRLWTFGEPAADTPAGRAARLAAGLPRAPLESFSPRKRRVVVDALFGAGLTRSLPEPAVRVALECRDSDSPVVAVDLPSGVHGDGAAPQGETFHAGVTVTFSRRKPAHLLQPCASRCGQVIVADIGFPARTIRLVHEAGAGLFENRPGSWLGLWPWPDAASHKYSRGHVAVFSGGPHSNGAARLCAMAAARIGAGAVTLLAPGSALQVLAAHLTSIMLLRVDTPADLQAFCDKRPIDAFAIGPGFGVGDDLRDFVSAIASGSDVGAGVVLDADALTAFQEAPDRLFRLIAGRSAVLTPHPGEFARLFPDIAERTGWSKVERTRGAAIRAGCVVLHKGADTVISRPDGQTVIEASGPPWLATAGSGDVLAGLIAGLLAQGMMPFEAACAAAWVHARAGRRYGPGLIADDLPDLVPAVLRELIEMEGPGQTRS